MSDRAFRAAGEAHDATADYVLCDEFGSPSGPGKAAPRVVPVNARGRVAEGQAVHGKPPRGRKLPVPGRGVPGHYRRVARIGVGNGQPGWVAALTPLSVDGMIVAA